RAGRRRRSAPRPTSSRGPSRAPTASRSPGPWSRRSRSKPRSPGSAPRIRAGGSPSCSPTAAASISSSPATSGWPPRGSASTANDITLDGMSFGSGSVPQDAVRSTRVVTSTYDVARGQFSGGLLASTTRSGTNVPQGSYTYTLRDKDLAWGGPTASPFGQGYTQNQVGGGMGGPIIANKLFVFGALQGRWRAQGLTSLSSADAATLARLGVSPDS